MLNVTVPIANPSATEKIFPNFKDSSIMLNVTAPRNTPDENEARSALNLRECLRSLEIKDAIKKGDATITDVNEASKRSCRSKAIRSTNGIS